MPESWAHTPSPVRSTSGSNRKPHEPLSGFSHHPVPPAPSGHISWAGQHREPPHPHSFATSLKAEEEPRHPRRQAEPDANPPQASPRREDAGAVGPAARELLHIFACDLHAINFHIQSLPLAPHGRAAPHSFLRAAGSPDPRSGWAAQSRSWRRIPSPLRPLIDGAALRVNPPLIPRKL